MQRRKIKCSQGHTHYSNRRYRKCMRMRQKGVDYLPVCRCGTRHRNRRKFAKCNNKYEAIISPIHEPIEEQQSQYDNPQIKPLNFVPNLHAIQVEPPIKTTVLNQPQLNRSSQVSPIHLLWEDSLPIEIIQFLNHSDHPDSLITRLHQHENLKDFNFGENLIICGPSNSGKAAYIRSHLRNISYFQIIINCSWISTEIQFMNNLKSKVRELLVIDNPSLLFQYDNQHVSQPSELNVFILSLSKRILLIVKDANILLNFFKQKILYNLFQMSNSLDKKISVVLTTTIINIKQLLVKRVRSRFKGFYIYIQPLKSHQIIQIMGDKIKAFIHEKSLYSSDERRCQFLRKLFQSIIQNQQLRKSIQKYQSLSNQNIIFYLNCLKLVLCKMDVSSSRQISHYQLGINIRQDFEQSFSNFPKSITINLIKNCTLPQILVLSIIYKMISQQFKQINVKKIMTIIHEQINHCRHQTMAFLRFFSARKLVQTLNGLCKSMLIQCQDLKISMESQVYCSVLPFQIKVGVRMVENLPSFIRALIDR